MLLFIRGKSLDIIRMPVHIKIQTDDTSSTHFINMGIRQEHIVCKSRKCVIPVVCVKLGEGM